MVPQLILTLLQATLPRDIVATANRSPVIQSLIGSRWNIALALVPICLAIAITRSGLWAIETLINRALVYGSLTATISAIYLACVGGAQLAAQAITGRTGLPEVALVVTTLLVAALFTPLRRRLQAAVDRRFYRRKYDAARTLAAFSATLRTETDLRQLREQLVRVVNETMQPASVSLWLRSPHARRQEVRP